MKSGRVVLFLMVISLLSGMHAGAQTVPDFDMEAYKVFLAAHSDMTTDQLLSLHPAGTSGKAAATQSANALYFVRLDSLYMLTADEKTLFDRNGFVVTERVSPTTFASAFLQNYNADLPLFISTDAILRAVHMSYDQILKTAEKGMLSAKVGDALTKIHAQLAGWAGRVCGSRVQLL